MTSSLRVEYFIRRTIKSSKQYAMNSKERKKSNCRLVNIIEIYYLLIESYFSSSSKTQKKMLSHYRNFLINNLVLELLRLIFIFYNSSIRDYRRQHVSIFKSIHIFFRRVICIDSLTSSVIRMSINLVNSDNAKARLLISTKWNAREE